MNRLQKKCIMATAGFHLLLLVILFVGPAFFWSREKPDDSPVNRGHPCQFELIRRPPASAAHNRRRRRQRWFNRSPHPRRQRRWLLRDTRPTPEKVEPVKPVKETVKRI